jgi:hypothetical protein
MQAAAEIEADEELEAQQLNVQPGERPTQGGPAGF